MKRLNYAFIMGLIFIVASVTAYATNLGVYGALYPITEEDLTAFIKTRLAYFQKTGKLQAMEQAFINKTEQAVIRPSPVTGLATTPYTTVRYMTPSFTLTNDVRDAEGHLVYPAGTHLNPLDPTTFKAVNPVVYVPYFDETLLFINADERAQVAWAKQAALQLSSHHERYKIICTEGNIATTSDQLGRIYFDENGKLSTYFTLTHVPSVITRDHTRFKITEVKVNG